MGAPSCCVSKTPTRRAPPTRRSPRSCARCGRWSCDWDEGPEKPGPHGPYRQTERHQIYRAHIDRLLDAGHLYVCFYTAEQLEAERQAAQAGKGAWVYSGACRDLDASEVAARKAAGEP